jgi:hypothetical protein
MMMVRETKNSECRLNTQLDVLQPPAPSDTLRARLKRDFVMPPVGHGEAPMRPRPWMALRAPAVAAALVLAVAFGIQYAPQPLDSSANTVTVPAPVPLAITALPADTFEEDGGAAPAALALAETGPNAARVTLTLVGGGYGANENGPVLESTEPLDDLPLY